MGFSLADIVRILEVYDDRDQLEQFFSARQRELEAISQDTAHKLTLLDAARKRLRKEEDMSYNVTIKSIPERYAATVHMTLPRYVYSDVVGQAFYFRSDNCRMVLGQLPRAFRTHLDVPESPWNRAASPLHPPCVPLASPLHPLRINCVVQTKPDTRERIRCKL